MRTIVRYYEQYKLRKYYHKLRTDAVMAEKTGDRKRYITLNAIADRMIDQVIYF